MKKVVRYGEFLGKFMELDTDERRKKTIEHIYNTFKVIDHFELKGETYFITEGGK